MFSNNIRTMGQPCTCSHSVSIYRNYFLFTCSRSIYHCKLHTLLFKQWVQFKLSLNWRRGIVVRLCLGDKNMCSDVPWCIHGIVQHMKTDNFRNKQVQRSQHQPSKIQKINKGDLRSLEMWACKQRCPLIFTDVVWQCLERQREFLKIDMKQKLCPSTSTLCCHIYGTI